MLDDFTAKIIEESSVDVTLSDPDYFLHTLDLQQGVFGYLKSSRDILSSASFLDGRSTLSNDKNLYCVPIAAALEWHKGRPEIDGRFIFHKSFCGSTLLARTFDFQERVFSYKEPQILVELAELKANGAEICGDQERWNALLGFVLSQFNQPFTPGEVNLIKPSNWVNSVLPELIHQGNSKAVFLGIDAALFLTAVFRGGSERIQYVYRFLQHITKVHVEFSELIAELDQSSLDTVPLFSRLSLIAHAVQANAFSQACTLIPEASQYSCSYTQLLSDSQSCINRASDALSLGLSDSDIGVTIEKTFSTHSKVSTRTYDQNEINKVNDSVEVHYKNEFSDAMSWYQDRVAPLLINPEA